MLCVVFRGLCVMCLAPPPPPLPWLPRTVALFLIYFTAELLHTNLAKRSMG